MISCRLILLIIIVALFGTEKINAVSDEKITDKEINTEEVMKIPFTFKKSKFCFKVKVSNKECCFMLDNGSLWDQLLFFGSNKIDSLNFDITGETKLGNSVADLASGIELEIEGKKFPQQEGVITRYNKNKPDLWEGIDGQVSGLFFNNYVVKIDFLNSYLVLYPIKSFNYNGNGQVFKMKEGPFNSRTIDAIISTDNGDTKLDLLIDLGGLFGLYLPYNVHEKITLPIDAKEAVLGGFQGRENGYIGTINNIHLGKYQIKNVKTAFKKVDENETIYGNTMIGLPLLKKFTVYFDYNDNRLILEN